MPVKQLVSFLGNPPKNGRFYTIAIDGRAGSGKTTLADYIAKLLPNYTHLNGDDYFEPSDSQLVWGAFNDKRFIQDVIEPLQSSNSFTYSPYDWSAETPITSRNIIITNGLVLERCYSFKFNLLWDLKIWGEVPRELCLKRGVARERLPKNTVLETWQKVWQPAEDKYIAKFRPKIMADIVIDGTKSFEEQIS